MASPGAKTLVTTRFAKLLPGFVEVALGLLTEEETVELLLGTADVKAPTAEQIGACKTLAKMCGACCEVGLRCAVCAARY